MVCLVPAALALDPNQAIARFIHNEWGAEQGYPGGPVYAITQTDGYLWIGTAKGLFRFDGTDFRLIRKAGSTQLPEGPVLGLVGDDDASLWIRPRSPSLLAYRNSTLQNVLAGLPVPETGIAAMC